MGDVGDGLITPGRLIVAMLLLSSGLFLGAVVLAGLGMKPSNSGSRTAWFGLAGMGFIASWLVANWWLQKTLSF